MIDWKVNPIAIQFGSVQIRWYGICFLAAILTAIRLMEPAFKRKGRDPEEATSLTIHVVIGIVIGSRLMHCFAYDPSQYLSNPLRVLKIWEGGLSSHGAALGALLGSWVWVRGHIYYSSLWLGERSPSWLSKLGVFLFGEPVYEPGLSWRQMVDIAAPAMTLTICYIRLGNLFNHEIVGRQTDVAFAFRFWYRPEIHNPEFAGAFYQTPAAPLSAMAVLVAMACFIAWIFPRSDEDKEFGFPIHIAFAVFFLLRFLFEFVAKHNGIPPEGMKAIAQPLPRHPSQIYELIMGLGLFALIQGIAVKRDGKHGDGFRLFLFMAVYFFFRFNVEWFKEYQSEYAHGKDQAPLLTMGQLLSLPFFLATVPLVWWSWSPSKELDSPDDKPDEQKDIKESESAEPAEGEKPKAKE